ncbi:glycosyltransferase family 4 protein [bacterium]|nr:glycosyltransferase family 4 protein [bacterium]
MKIGMILDRVFPPDIRVEKEARTLLKAGHELYLLCMRGSASDLPDDDIYEGIKLHRRDFYPKSPIIRKFNALISRLTFKNYKLISQIEKFVDENSIEVLHVHDLPMVRTALVAGERKGVPVVADLHENYPAAMQIYLTGASFKAKFLNGVKRWKKYENDCLKRVYHIIVVVDEARERVFNDYNVPESKVTVVSNTEDVDFFENLKLDQNLIDSYKDYFVITYVGGFGPHRGLDVPIKAMPILKEKIPNVRLLLVGEGGNRAELEQLAANLGVSQDVEFTGWQPFNLVPSYISLSDICLVPHHSNPHTDSTIPHKIFQYMLMRKPVVVSTCKPLARIVNETQAGLVFESGNSDDFARVCLELLDADKRKHFGENGRQAVLTKYNWEKTGTALVKVYQKLGE